MSTDPKAALLAAVRVVLVALGVGVAALTVLELAAMPPPPPDSDGFAHGMAAVFGSVIIVTSLGVAAVGVTLPTLLGLGDPLGFSRWQRRTLQGAGILIGGGIAVGLAFGLLTELQYGIVLWLGLVVLATLMVGAVLVWRLGEAVVRLLVRTVGEDASG